MIDGRQIRAARALLGWNRDELLARAQLSMSALLRLEQGAADSRRSTIIKVVQTLEAAGIVFITREDGAIGVLLKPDPVTGAWR
jgi:predicted transcriptional regulator